jgi:hypothetical protein
MLTILRNVGKYRYIYNIEDVVARIVEMSLGEMSLGESLYRVSIFSTRDSSTGQSHLNGL